MKTNYLTKQLIAQFSGQKEITREDLFSFYKETEPELKEATFGWRIYALKQKNLITTLKRGVYTLNVKPVFHPQLDSRLVTLNKKIKKQFPEIQCCIWSTRWLHDWTVHQPGKNMLLIEVEAAATESVFYFLKDQGYRQVFLNPDDTLLDRYVFEQPETLIVKTLVTRAPVQLIHQLTIPSAEKILVDVFIDKNLYTSFQGSELSNMFNQAYKTYALNKTTMLAYAKRRTKDRELQDFLSTYTVLNQNCDH